MYVYNQHLFNAVLYFYIYNPSYVELSTDAQSRCSQVIIIGDVYVGWEHQSMYRNDSMIDRKIELSMLAKHAM